MASSDAPVARSGQTIVKLRDGSGEPPLIVLHGMYIVPAFPVSWISYTSYTKVEAVPFTRLGL